MFNIQNTINNFVILKRQSLPKRQDKQHLNCFEIFIDYFWRLDKPNLLGWSLYLYIVEKPSVFANFHLLHAKSNFVYCFVFNNWGSQFQGPTTEPLICIYIYDSFIETMLSRIELLTIILYFDLQNIFCLILT